MPPHALGTIFALALSLAAVSAEPTYWALKPTADPQLKAGERMAIHGATAPEGVYFKWEGLDVQQPCQVVVVTEPGTPLELRAFKQNPDQPLQVVKADANGVAALEFRTGETIRFRLSAPELAPYQMAVWAGPKIPVTAPAAFQPMSKVAGTTAAPAVPAATQPPAAATQSPSMAATTKAMPAGGFGSLWTLGFVLIGLLLLILAGLGIVSYQLARRPVTMGVKTLMAALAMLAPMMISAQAQPKRFHGWDGNLLPLSEDQRVEMLKPSLLPQKEETPTLVDRYDALNDRIGKYQSLQDPAGRMLNAAEAMRPLLEQFGLIDPAENAVTAEMNPDGLPELPSSYLDDQGSPYSAERSRQFEAIQRQLVEARELLENNYVVLKKTEIETKRLMELADGTAGLSPLSQFAWTQMKSNPKEGFNQSRAAFYQKYDDGQSNGLRYVKEALMAMNDFEKTHYGRENWYLYFGLPYYNFLAARYQR